MQEKEYQATKKPGQKKPKGQGTAKAATRRLDNRNEIIVTGVFFAAVFAVMIVYLCYFTATSQEEMLNNSYNSRQEVLLSRNYRGSIYSRDGEVLAETVLDEEQQESRVYPFGDVFSHIVGYASNGRMGVEALANYYLINTSTSLRNKAANDAAGVKNPGDSVYTTLDVQIQEAADFQLNILKGAAIVTEISTGKILAMVSHPDFDPNQISEIWDSLIENKDSSVLLNRATQGQYPPGSTFKSMTALEYIRENPDIYSQYSYQCEGAFQLEGSRINCYNKISHGEVSFERSFAKSCNASFANMGASLDRGKFRETLESLLFNQPLPLDLPYSQSKTTISADSTTDEILQTSIGQGRTQMSPIHLHMITSAIANGGVLMKPYVLDHVENDAKRVIKSFVPENAGQLISPSEAEILKNMMIAVVEGGTGRKLSGLSYTAAGKTGSAEYNDKGDSHSWFTGFAPAEEPEVCVTVIVEGAGSGGDYAVPIAKRLFEAYFNEK